MNYDIKNNIKFSMSLDESQKFEKFSKKKNNSSPKLSRWGSYYGSTKWADSNLRYVISLLKDNSTWNCSHNFYFKKMVVEMIIARLSDFHFVWHVKIARINLHRWFGKKSWESLK